MDDNLETKRHILQKECMEFCAETFYKYIPRGKEVLKCRNCKSIYIENDVCEACGLNLSFDWPGEPFGERSFYALKERYILSLPFWVKLYPDFEDPYSKKTKEYVRALKFRYDCLSDYFLNSNDINKASKEFSDTKKNWFQIELNDLTQELKRYRIIFYDR